MANLLKAIKQLAERLLGRAPPPPKEAPPPPSHLAAAQTLILFEDPLLSFTALLLLRIALLFVFELDLHIFGIVFLLFNFMLVCDFYLKGEDKEDESLFRRLEKLFAKAAVQVKVERSARPHLFAACLLGAYLIFNSLGCSIVSFICSYLVCLGGFLLPKLLPDPMVQSSQKVFDFICSGEGVISENELLPNLAGAAEEDLQQDSAPEGADLYPSLLLRDDQEANDSSLNPFISGIEGMPSHLDDGVDGLDSSDQFSFALTAAKRQKDSSDSEPDSLALNPAMEVDKSLSSSSDDDSLVRGLKFASQEEDREGAQSRVLENLTSIGASLVQSVLQAAVKVKSQGSASSGSSDSEFELIEASELAKEANNQQL